MYEDSFFFFYVKKHLTDFQNESLLYSDILNNLLDMLRPASQIETKSEQQLHSLIVSLI